MALNGNCPETGSGRFFFNMTGLQKAALTPAYKKAKKLIDRLASLQNAPNQNAYVALLAEKYKAKRNFIKLVK